MSTVVAMNSEEFMRKRFNDIMANAKPMMTKGCGKTLHTITASANVPLDLCYVDERYEGMRRHKHIKRLENKWDERKLSNITLVPHPEEYRFCRCSLPLFLRCSRKAFLQYGCCGSAWTQNWPE